jgi:hypothetical protein
MCNIQHLSGAAYNIGQLENVFSLPNKIIFMMHKIVHAFHIRKLFSTTQIFGHTIV